MTLAPDLLARLQPPAVPMSRLDAGQATVGMNLGRATSIDLSDLPFNLIDRASL